MEAVSSLHCMNDPTGGSHGKPPSATPLWKLVNPYRGLEAMSEANADYFYGHAVPCPR
jgi:hypothetical protein